jgi:hypothetical protein
MAALRTTKKMGATFKHPKKADGSQQFYDSKQQKVFVRDANGNIVPPKE